MWCVAKAEGVRGCGSVLDYFTFSYSALASFRMEMSGSASFQSVRKSRYAACALVLSPVSAYARPRQ